MHEAKVFPDATLSLPQTGQRERERKRERDRGREIKGEICRKWLLYFYF